MPRKTKAALEQEARSAAAAALGRVGGAVRSDAKTEAARANGRLGGRPRKPGSTPRTKPATTVAARYVVDTVTSQIRTIREPHQVVDLTTGQVVDAYASKRAATMHARDLNRATTSTTEDAR